MAGALDGIRVLELASYVTGPYAGVLLADMGAEVIKIEEPGSGDPFRGWGEGGGYSPTFCSLNRNKKSVTLDLRSDDGRAALEALIETADVLIENFRPGVAERRGFGFEAVQKRNQRLVYCSITGFGASGPYRERPGYDTVGQAMSGLLSLLTDLEDPKGMGISLSDHLTGIFACYGILGALMAREKTGLGQLVQTSLLQATIAFTAENAARYFVDGKVPNRAARTRLAGVFAFRASDGKPFVIHLSSPPRFWEGLVKAVERPDLATDVRFKTRPARQLHHAELVDELERIFCTAPREVWLSRLLANDVPAAPLNAMDEVFDDPQVQHLGMRVSIEHPERGVIQMVGPGVSLDGTPLMLHSAPPLLGEHNAELLGALHRTPIKAP
jgi:crotonobetainyl-CoA:carnitine CoA-transferase CaiB-like acyl-CoA transferase